MPAPAALVLGMLLAAAPPTEPGRAGEGRAHTLRPGPGVSAARPDTSRRAAPDSATQRPALPPDAATPDDDDKPTRKTALLTALAIAVLTISTLLLYNVRSR